MPLQDAQLSSNAIYALLRNPGSVEAINSTSARMYIYTLVFIYHWN